jgi:hypothetical protein
MHTCKKNSPGKTADEAKANKQEGLKDALRFGARILMAARAGQRLHVTH